MLPGGIRAGIAEDELELLARTITVYRATVADRHAELLAAAGRRDAAAVLEEGQEDGRTLRELAAAAADAADTQVALQISTAAVAGEAEMVLAQQAHITALVRLAAAESAAGEIGESADVSRWRLRLMSRASDAALHLAPVPAQASVPAGSTLAGAA